MDAIRCPHCHAKIGMHDAGFARRCLAALAALIEEASRRERRNVLSPAPPEKRKAS